MRTASVSSLAFAATLIALGILGLIKGDFTPVWQPVPAGVPGREALIYLCALMSLTCGLGLLWQRTAFRAARVLLFWLVLWTLIFRVPEIRPAPTVVASWFGVSETAVFVAAAWLLCAGATGRRIASMLYGLALIHFGLAHLVYVKETTALVPGWLPSHVAWAYFTGAAYIAAGVSLLVGVWSRLAATLAAVQIAGFTLLVWLPIVAAGSRDPFQWSETILSCALTAAAWVIADSYRNVPWLRRATTS
jgi:uncharacterized membrane protein